MDYKTFASKVKSKYPEYNNLDDLDLAQRVVAKYPEYKSEVDFNPSSTSEMPPLTDLATKATSIVNRLTPNFQPTLQSKTLPGQILESLGKVTPPDVEYSNKVKAATNAAIENIATGRKWPALMPRSEFGNKIAALGATIAQQAVNAAPFSSLDVGLLAGSDLIKGTAAAAVNEPLDAIEEGIKRPSITPVSGARQLTPLQEDIKAILAKRAARVLPEESTYQSLTPFKVNIPEKEAQFIQVPETTISGQKLLSSQELALEKTPLPPNKQLIKLEPFAKARPETEPVPETVKDPVTQETKLQRPVTPQDVTEIAPGKWMAFKRTWIDKFSPIQYKKGYEIAPEFANAGGLQTEPFVAAHLMSGRMQSMGSTILKDVNKLLDPIENNKQLNAFNEIYSLRNFIELDRQGKTTSGITEGIAQNSLNNLKSKLGETVYNQINKTIDEVAKLQSGKPLDMLADPAVNVLSPDAVKTLRERYPTFLHSEIADDQLSQQYPEFLGNPNALNRSNKGFLKTKEGTDLQINTNAIDVIRRSILTKIAVAEKARVMNSIAEKFGTQIGQQFFKEGKLVSEIDPHKIPPGYIKSGVKLPGGKTYAFPKDVYDMITGLNAKEADFITNMVGKFNSYFRAGATAYRLPFALGNLPRDIGTAFYTHRFVPGQMFQPKAYALGFAHALADELGIKSSTVRAWQEGGGAYAGLMSSIPADVPLPFRLRPRGEQITKILTKPLTLTPELVNKFSSTLENTSHLAEYIRLKNTNLPEQLKLLAGRNVTVDFDVFGEAMRNLNRWIPFLNAKAQGNINTLKAFRDQPIRSTLRAATGIIVPSIAFKLWNQKFENSKYIDPYIYYNSWPINTGISIKRNGINVPITIRIPKSEIAQQLSYPTESLIEYLRNDPMYKQRAKDWTTENLESNIMSNFSPPFARVPAELAANYDFYRQQQIVPDRLRNVSPGMQFKSGTPNLVRRIGELTGLNPIKFEHAVEGLYPASRQVLEFLDSVIKTMPNIPRNNKDVLQRLQAFQPFVYAPTGYYNSEDEATREFKQQKDVEAGTPRFLFREAMTKYLNDKTPENLKLVQKFGQGLTGKERQEIIKDKIKNYKISLINDDKIRAIQKILPRKYKKEYATIQ